MAREVENYKEEDDISEDVVDFYEKMDVEEATDKIGMGKFHWAVYLIVGLFTAADSVEIGFVSFVTEVLKEQWGITEATKATMESMVFVGQIIGAPTWGWLADKYGRRNIMLISALWVSVAGFLTAASVNETMLIFVRFLVGIGVAGCVVAFDIFAEALPTQWRGPLCMSTFYWFTIGSLYANIAAKLTLCSLGWRWYTIVCALPTLVAAVMGYFLVPESAHWLVAEGRGEEAADVLNGIAEMNGSDVRFKEVTHQEHNTDSVSTLDLVKKSKLRTPLIFMCLTWLGFGLAYYGIALMLPHLFSEHGDECEGELPNLPGVTSPNVAPLRKNATCEKCHPVPENCFCLSFSFTDIIISNACQALGLTVGVLTVNKIGRVKTQQILYLIGAVFAIGLGFPKIDHRLLTIFSSTSLAAINGASSCTWAHTPEIFPTHARVVATGVCSAAARVGAASSPYVITDYIPPLPTALIMSAFSFMSAISISFTKDRTNEHIENDDIDTSEADE